MKFALLSGSNYSTVVIQGCSRSLISVPKLKIESSSRSITVGLAYNSSSGKYNVKMYAIVTNDALLFGACNAKDVSVIQPVISGCNFSVVALASCGSKFYK